MTRPALLFWYQTMKTTAAARSPPTITIGRMILLVLEELSEGAAPWFAGGALGAALAGGVPAVESPVGSGRTGGFSTELAADPAAGGCDSGVGAGTAPVDGAGAGGLGSGGFGAGGSDAAGAGGLDAVPAADGVLAPLPILDGLPVGEPGSGDGPA